MCKKSLASCYNSTYTYTFLLQRRLWRAFDLKLLLLLPPRCMRFNAFPSIFSGALGLPLLAPPAYTLAGPELDVLLFL